MKMAVASFPPFFLNVFRNAELRVPVFCHIANDQNKLADIM